MDASRDIDAHGVDDAEWEAHVARARGGDPVGPQRLARAAARDGHTMICTMAPLSGGKLLVSYVDVTEMKQREAELADALEKARSSPRR